MRLCLPTADSAGLPARLSPHFGSAPYLTLVDTDSGRTEVLANDHSLHAPGRCEPAKGLYGRSVDAVVCRGLGRRALAHLNWDGIPVLVTDADTVSAALDAFHAGALRALTEEEACGGGHGDAHASRPERSSEQA